MKAPFDRYTIQARIQPALLTGLPGGLFTLVWLSTEVATAGIAWTVIVTGGGTALLAQIGRDLGRRKQPRLYEQWGGPPTTRKLRFRDSVNRDLLNRRRQKLEGLLQCQLPSEDDETQNPSEADEQYESAVAYLLEVTRDRNRFPLVQEENINYGFRRNLWGLKPYGVTIAALAALATWGLFLSDILAGSEGVVLYERLFVSFDAELIARLLGALVNTLFLAGWILVIRPYWVKTTAEAYAERLLAAIDVLP